MTKILNKFERYIVLTLLGLMMIAVLVSTIELATILVEELLKPPILLLNIREMLTVFGFFLMVLIGLELLETIKAYLEQNTIHAEIVLLVAIVAIARKVIILDFKSLTPEMLLAMSAMVIALALGFFLIKRALSQSDKSKES